MRTVSRSETAASLASSRSSATLPDLPQRGASPVEATWAGASPYAGPEEVRTMRYTYHRSFRPTRVSVGGGGAPGGWIGPDAPLRSPPIDGLFTGPLYPALSLPRIEWAVH